MAIPRTGIMYNVKVFDIASNEQIGSGYIVYHAEKRYGKQHDAHLVDFNGADLPRDQAYKLIQIDEPVIVVVPRRAQ